MRRSPGEGHCTVFYEPLLPQMFQMNRTAYVMEFNEDSDETLRFMRTLKT
jgi:hypothetical protein